MKKLLSFLLALAIAGVVSVSATDLNSAFNLSDSDSSLNFTPIACSNVHYSFTASLSSSTLAVSNGDAVKIYINVGTESLLTEFSSAEIILTYDASKLSYDSAKSNLSGAAAKADGKGRLTIEDYGVGQSFGNVYLIAFTAETSGSATVTLTSAAFGTSSSAETKDLVSATVADTTKTVTVSIGEGMYNVSLDREIFNGAGTAEYGSDYTFSQTSDGVHYDYGQVTATVNGVSVKVIDNGDRTYTIKNITGALVISGTRSAKTFNVSLSGDVESIDGDKATYGEDYKFTLKEDVAAGSEAGSAYYLMSITVGGTGYTAYIYDETTRTYTVPGRDITGEIAIVIDTKEIPVSAFVITLDGATGVVTGDYPATVLYGGDHTITIVAVEGYQYTVSATIDGQNVTVISNGDNTYTVNNITGDIIFRITATTSPDRLKMSEYLTLDGAMMWLIINDVYRLSDSVYTINGSNMFWSDKYGAYCYLTISDTVPEVALGIVSGVAEDVDYGMDINGTGTVTEDDAQLAYDMYNALYDSFTDSIAPENYLMADINGSGSITVEDVSAVIDGLLDELD